MSMLRATLLPLHLSCHLRLIDIQNWSQYGQRTYEGVLQAVVNQLYSKRYYATWNVSMNATTPAEFQPAGQVSYTSVTCSVYVQ